MSDKYPVSEWYEDLLSECPECLHGPKWHHDLDGCTRMNPSWCPCTRIYRPQAEGPADYTTALLIGMTAAVQATADKERGKIR